MAPESHRGQPGRGGGHGSLEPIWQPNSLDHQPLHLDAPGGDASYRVHCRQFPYSQRGSLPGSWCPAPSSGWSGLHLGSGICAGDVNHSQNRVLHPVVNNTVHADHHRDFLIQEGACLSVSLTIGKRSTLLATSAGRQWSLLIGATENQKWRSGNKISFEVEIRPIFQVTNRK